MPTNEPTPTRSYAPGPAPSNTSEDAPDFGTSTDKPSSTTKTTTSDKSKVGQQNAETMPEEVAQALSPYESVLNALPAEYQSAMASVNAGIDQEKSTGNAGLDSAIQAVNQETLAGEAPVESALKGLGVAGQQMETDLPYSDVLSTLLTEKKNELQYGTIPTYTVDTSHWSKPLQNIYDYIQGSGSGSATDGVAATSGDALPSISAAASGTTGTGSIPAAGGPGLGQAGG